MEEARAPVYPCPRPVLTHRRWCSQADEATRDEAKLQKLGFNLDPELVDVCIPPSIQSGGAYNVRPHRITKYVAVGGSAARGAKQADVRWRSPWLRAVAASVPPPPSSTKELRYDTIILCVGGEVRVSTCVAALSELPPSLAPSPADAVLTHRHCVTRLRRATRLVSRGR